MFRQSGKTQLIRLVLKIVKRSCPTVLKICFRNLDEILYSPSTKPCQDRTACGSRKPIISSQFHHPVGTSTITSSKTDRNLGVVIDDQLTFSDHISKTAQYCRFALFNINTIRPFLSEHASQFLVQTLVLSRLDYCNALLAGIPATSIKPLQLIQNTTARLILNEPKRMHVTPLFINLHWLPIAARIQFKSLMFAYKTTTGSAPFYLNSLLQTYVSRSLSSRSEHRFIITSQRGTKSLSLTFK